VPSGENSFLGHGKRIPAWPIDETRRESRQAVTKDLWFLMIWALQWINRQPRNFQHSLSLLSSLGDVTVSWRNMFFITSLFTSQFSWKHLLATTFSISLLIFKSTADVIIFWQISSLL
jgi:hypothetical protein